MFYQKQKYNTFERYKCRILQTPYRMMFHKTKMYVYNFVQKDFCKTFVYLKNFSYLCTKFHTSIKYIDL